MKVLLIIPAYNEEENIADVVDELRDDYGWYDYVVVNDGSQDATAEICRANGYNLIDLPANVGLAGAFQAGVRYAELEGYDCAIQFDADGQHLPQYLDALVDELSRCNIAIGSRYVAGKRPRSLRSFGGRLISSMVLVTTGQRISDCTSGMRAYDRKAIDELAHGANLGPEPDTIAFLMRKKGLIVHEVPVAMADRSAGKSYLSPWKSMFYMLRTALSVLLIQFFR